jgi:hypothetical protein
MPCWHVRHRRVCIVLLHRDLRLHPRPLLRSWRDIFNACDLRRGELQRQRRLNQLMRWRLHRDRRTLLRGRCNILNTCDLRRGDLQRARFCHGGLRWAVRRWVLRRRRRDDAAMLRSMPHIWFARAQRLDAGDVVRTVLAFACVALRAGNFITGGAITGIVIAVVVVSAAIGVGGVRAFKRLSAAKERTSTPAAVGSTAGGGGGHWVRRHDSRVRGARQPLYVCVCT